MTTLELRIRIVAAAVHGKLPPAIGVEVGMPTDYVRRILKTAGYPDRDNLATHLDALRRQRHLPDAADTRPAKLDTVGIADMITRGRKSRRPRVVTLTARAESVLADLAAELAAEDRERDLARRRAELTEELAKIDQMAGRKRARTMQRAASDG